MKLNSLVLCTLAGLAQITPVVAEELALPVLDIGGLVEVEAVQVNDYAGVTSSDISVATLELIAAAQVSTELSAQIVLLYEEGGAPLDVDVATFTYHAAEAAWSLTAGQTYLPFGHFASNMVADPLLLEMGEIRETAIQLDIESGPFLTSIYLFNGDDKANKTTGDQIDNYGFNISYNHSGSVNVDVNLSYINDFANTDVLQASISTGTTDDYIAATALGVAIEAGSFRLIAEHLTALSHFETSELSFNGNGAKPSATMLEVAYTLTLGGKPAIIALGQQMTTEAVVLGLPENRTLLSLSVDVIEHAVMSFELMRDTDYSVADGGSGDAATAFTAKLGFEF